MLGTLVPDIRTETFRSKIMRYYYYGGEDSHSQKQVVHAMHVQSRQRVPAVHPGDRDLVIEDDTIYEIDRECIRCREQNS